MQSAKWYRVVPVALAIGVLASLVPAQAEAQANVERKFLGVHAGLSGYGSTAAFGVNGEVPYNDRIHIGGFVNTWSYGQSWSNSSWNVRYIAFAATGSYHFPVESNPKLDPFLGAALGYYVVSTSAEVAGGVAYGGSAASSVLLGGYGGIRYFFRDNIAAAARAGVGATYLSLGVDFAL